MAIGYLDGRRFRNVVVAGADWVRQRRDHINSINVFPVADGDTGTNMALSLSATASAIRAVDDLHLGRVATLAAEASILGAKGNSGVILAHWFLGLARTFQADSRAGPRQVASALGHATRTVYAAIEQPVEGTILTVMRAVSDGAAATAVHEVDLAALLGAMIDSGEEALARTPEQLEALRIAAVVDAGARGYVDFLEGAARAVRGELAVHSSAAPADGRHLAAHAEDGDLEHRFCTEVVVRGRGLDERSARRRLRPLGSALLVVTTGSVLKAHIHTNRPDEVIRIAGRLGEVAERKVDDMLRQREERGGAGVEPLVPLGSQGDHVAVVCDSTADLPVELRRQLGMEMAPLQVLFGDRVYRDQVELSTDEFYKLLATGENHPTTSQPPPRAFVEALDRVRPDREVLVVTLSSRVSGTHDAARAGTRLAPHPRVEVFDSATASLGLGMLAMNAARLAAMGAAMDEVLAWLARWREDSGLVFCLATLEFLRRGGRIGAARGIIGRLLDVRPILTFDEGAVAPLDSARGEEEAFEKTVRALESRLPAGDRLRLGLIRIGEARRLDDVEARLRARCDIVECIRGAPTGVVGAHAGPGAWGVFYQRVRADDPLLEGR